MGGIPIAAAPLLKASLRVFTMRLSTLALEGKHASLAFGGISMLAFMKSYARSRLWRDLAFGAGIALITLSES